MWSDLRTIITQQIWNGYENPCNWYGLMKTINKQIIKYEMGYIVIEKIMAYQNTIKSKWWIIEKIY